MWPDRVSNPGPLIYESGTLPTALRGPAGILEVNLTFMYRQQLSSFQVSRVWIGPS